MKTNDELIEEFDLKFYTLVSENPDGTTTRKGVNYEMLEWLRTVLTQKDAEVARKMEETIWEVDIKLSYLHYNLRNAIRNERRGLNINGHQGDVDKYVNELCHLITNKGDTNN